MLLDRGIRCLAPFRSDLNPAVQNSATFGLSRRALALFDQTEVLSRGLGIFSPKLDAAGRKRWHPIDRIADRSMTVCAEAYPVLNAAASFVKGPVRIGTAGMWPKS